MLSFKQFILEINNPTFDDHETDSRISFMALKDHLRKKDNFKKFIDSRKSKNGMHTYTVPLEELNVHPEIKKKYKKLKGFTFGIHPDGKSHGEFIDNHVIGYNFDSLHPDKIKTSKLEDVHKRFLEQLNNNFGTFHHEFMHAHQKYVQGKPPKIPFIHALTGTKPEEYVNYKHEVEAHSKEIGYHLEKAVRTAPHKFIFSSSANGTFPGFNNAKETEHYSILRDLDRHISDQQGQRTSFANVYKFSSEENRKKHGEIIDRIMKQYRNKIFLK